VDGAGDGLAARLGSFPGNGIGVEGKCFGEVTAPVGDSPPFDSVRRWSYGCWQRFRGNRERSF